MEPVLIALAGVLVLALLVGGLAWVAIRQGIFRGADKGELDRRQDDALRRRSSEEIGAQPLPPPTVIDRWMRGRDK